MAVIWQHRSGNKHYEVRSAGRARRLYTNGVFHSQYNPAQPVSGGVWDLLFLPALFRAPDQVRRVLVLGVGGGAVIRQLQHFVAPRSIVGVDLDPHHLAVARRYFGVAGEEVTLFRADAVEWVTRWRGEPFDLVIDDLFAECDGEPVRAVDARPRWFQRLHRLLAPGAALVMNFPTRRSLQESGYFTSHTVRRRYAAAYGFSLPLYQNAVAALLREPGELRHLNRRLRRFPELDRRRKGCRLRYRVITLSQ